MATIDIKENLFLLISGKDIIVHHTDFIDNAYDKKILMDKIRSDLFYLSSGTAGV